MCKFYVILFVTLNSDKHNYMFTLFEVVIFLAYVSHVVICDFVFLFLRQLIHTDSWTVNTVQ